MLVRDVRRGRPNRPLPLPRNLYRLRLRWQLRLLLRFLSPRLLLQSLFRRLRLYNTRRH